MAEVCKDVAFVDGDACCREEAAVFGLRDERANDRDAGRVGGDGVVDRAVREEGHRLAAHVVGGASDGPSSGTGEVGSVRRTRSYRMPDRSCVHSDAQRQRTRDGQGGS